MIKSICCLFASFLIACASASSTEMRQSNKADIVHAVIKHLETDYVDEQMGLIAASALRTSFSEGAFDHLETGADYAGALSDTLQELTGDGHLNVEYSEKAIPVTNDAAENFSASEMEKWYGAHLNFGVERVERLPGNIGLIDLRVFAPIDMGAETVSAAMNITAHMDGLIIDLRENGGGIGDMANLVASYLFDTEPKPLTGIYDRPSDTLTQQFTQAYVPGPKFGAQKPVYVLISSKTFSAAEALAYNLQALGRATIVGETSGGGAHPFEYLPIHPHFVLWSVTAKSVNPITGGNWQGLGVVPDVQIEAASALEEATRLLQQQLGEKTRKKHSVVDQ